MASNDDWSAFRAKLLLMDDCVVCEIVKALWANVFAELTSAWVAKFVDCEVVRYDDSCVLFALLFNWPNNVCSTTLIVLLVGL